LKTNSFYTVAFNVLLTLPFGVYMRKYFHKSFWVTALLGLLLSFFYEFTQYTGLYGIYPHAYRFADVDDLIVNTFGTMVGFWITPLISKLLPTMESDPLPVQKQASISFVRRLLAYLIDVVDVSVFTGVINLLLVYFSVFPKEINLYTLMFQFLYYIVMVYYTKGKTFGYQLLKIQMISTTSPKLTFKQVLLRNGTVYFFLVLIPAISSSSFFA
ncbi:MAG: permease, partial [Clostridiales bacterium]|nr:permease [Clostridiales bacterium]